MSGLFDKFYNISPVWLQNIGISAYGLMWKNRRYGGKFHSLVSQFHSRENFTPDQWNDYQTQQLRQLLIHTYHNVPYYQKIFLNLSIDLPQLELFSINDLSKLPLLNKESIRSQPTEFISKAANPRRLNAYLTSGTTGTPLKILSSTQTDRAVQAAYEARVRNWVGLNWKMSRAMLGGRLVVPRADSNPPYWRYNLFERQLYMSAFHIAPENVDDYVTALNRFKPDYLVGYASAQYFLARMIQDQAKRVYSPKAVLTSSEKLTDEMRNTLSAVFQCEVYDGYSGVENCCLASECRYHNLHISPDVGIIELVDDNGNLTPQGMPGEIVATGLLNRDQPLIRYRTGDIAILSTGKCSCGVNTPFLEDILGRMEDTVIGLDGRELVRFHGIFVGLDNVREGQIIQDSLNEFTIRLVITDKFGDFEKKIINDRFKERLGNVKLVFVIVDQIERTARGKFPAVISHLHRSQTK